MFLRDGKTASWLCVPGLWPATQLHYSTFILPVMTPWAAVLLAIPTRGFVPLVVILYGVAFALNGWRDRLPLASRLLPVPAPRAKPAPETFAVAGLETTTCTAAPAAECCIGHVGVAGGR